ncbi:major facilitator superfamily domain-containing protein, partial [Circinella umbellata]
LGAGMINDVFQDSERGKAMSWYGCMSLYCMVSSPFIGGALTQYLGWRSIFWGFVIGYSVLWLVIVLVLPETNFHSSQSKQDCCYDFEATDGAKSSTTKNNSKTQATSWKNNMVNPFSSLKLLKFPNMLLCCSYLGLLGFTNNASAISFTWAYSIQYQLSPMSVGLFYLVGIIGNTAGTWLSGSMSDRIYIRRTNNAKMEDNPIYPEMRLSLKWQLVGGVFLAGGFTTYGWGTEKNVHFSLGIICLVLIQFGFSIVNSFITVYVVQSFSKHGSSAQGSIHKYTLDRFFYII